MIPKIIHYIWLGGNDEPQILKKCKASWKKYCPDYEIKRWDESNLNIDCCNYCRQAYDTKKYAFASDVLRFYILKDYGGIYVDIDVEILKPIDELLKNEVFSGFETSGFVAPGLIIGAEPNNKFINEFIEDYNKINFEYNPQKQVTICNLVTDKLMSYGLKCDNSTQNINGFVVYSSDYFSPKSLSDGKIRKTKNTLTIHHYEGTWLRKRDKFKSRILMFTKRLMGEKFVNKLKTKRKAKKVLDSAQQEIYEKKEIRVLHVLASNKYSGAENVACQISKALSGVCEFAYTSPNGQISTKLKDQNIKYYPLKKLNKRQLKRVIKEFNPTIVHAHDMKAIVISAFACKNTPIIAHIHCNHKDFKRVSLRSLLFKYLIKTKKIKHSIFVSNGCYNDYKYKNIFSNNYSILPNVINTKKFLEMVDNSNYTTQSDVVYLGRLTSIKNPIRILEITKLLKEKNKSIRVAIIGNGELEEQCRQYIAANDLKNNVTMFGFLENGYGLLKNGKVMILTSVSEGTPMCVLEAQALGLPIVSTKTDGMVDLLVDGKTGFLFNTNEEACEIIEDLLGNSEKYSQIKKTVLDFSNKYNDMSTYSERIKNLYYKSLEK